MEIALRLVFGLLVALGVGHIGLEWVLPWLRGKMGLSAADLQKVRPRYRVEPWLTGLVERLFFAGLVAWEAGGAGLTMIAWLAAKMAANWERPNPEVEDRDAQIGLAFSALIAGLLSMFFALVGGLIIGGKIP